MSIRPRFKIYKKRGINFLSSPRVAHRKRSMKEREKGKDIQFDVEPVLNEKLLLSPTQSLTDTHEGRSLRIKSVTGLIREHKKILKQIYGRDLRAHFGKESRKSVVAKLKEKAEEYEDSRLNRFETRLDVLRLRSGLAMSPAQGAWIVTIGLVVVSNIDYDEETNTVVKKDDKVIKSPNLRVKQDMTMISIKPKYYKKHIQSLSKYLTDENCHHVVPVYREVDWEKGSMVVLQLPKDGQVLRPKGAAVARASRLSY